MSSLDDNNDTEKQEISAESYRTSLSYLTSKMVLWYEQTQELDRLRKANPNGVKQTEADVLREAINKAFTETLNAYVDFRLLEASNPSYAYKTDFGVCCALPESVRFDTSNKAPGTKENELFLSLIASCREQGLGNLINRIAHQEGGSVSAVKRINQLVHVDQDQLRKGYRELLGSAPKVKWVKEART